MYFYNVHECRMNSYSLMKSVDGYMYEWIPYFSVHIIPYHDKQVHKKPRLLCDLTALKISFYYFSIRYNVNV